MVLAIFSLFYITGTLFLMAMFSTLLPAYNMLIRSASYQRMVN